MTPENTWFSLNKTLALKTLKKLFFTLEDVEYNCRLVESFSFKRDELTTEKKFSKSDPVIAFEVLPNECYYVLTRDEWWLWGIKPENYFFGLEQSIRLNFFKYPTINGNLVLCDDLTCVVAFLQIGVPAILIDPIAVWDNHYFNEIIAPNFKNLIVTFDKRYVPKSKKGQQIKFFNLKEQEYLDLKSDIWFSGADSILEGITALYEYIDDDRLNEEPQIKNITISY